MADELKIDSKRMLEGYPDAWVKFRNDGYPFKLAKQLRDASRENEILDIVLKYTESWHLPKVDGNWIGLESNGDKPTPDSLDEVDEAVVVAVIRAFYTFRQERMYSPLALST